MKVFSEIQSCHADLTRLLRQLAHVAPPIHIGNDFEQSEPGTMMRFTFALIRIDARQSEN